MTMPTPARLTIAEQRELGRVICQGRAAGRDMTAEVETMIAAMMGLVRKIARMYPLPAGVERCDVVQAGTVGLLEAVHSFDPDETPAAFTNWAYPRIKHAIRSSAETWTPMRVPRNSTDAWNAERVVDTGHGQMSNLAMYVTRARYVDSIDTTDAHWRLGLSIDDAGFDAFESSDFLTSARAQVIAGVKSGDLHPTSVSLFDRVYLADEKPDMTVLAESFGVARQTVYNRLAKIHAAVAVVLPSRLSA